MYQEPLLSLLSHALYPGQCRFYLALAAQTAMEGYTEPVRFVTNLLQHLQCRGIPVNEKRIWIPNTDDLFQPLGKSHYRKFVSKTEFRQCLIGKIELSLASVNDYQLRQVIRVFTQHAGIPAVHHLFH